MSEGNGKPGDDEHRAKYDDVRWHCGKEFPEDLPGEAAATHIGMFVAWAVLSGLAGSIHQEEFPEDLRRLKAREITPGSFFLDACAGKFTTEDLNERGNAFTRKYYDDYYVNDYLDALVHNVPTIFHVADTWENFDRLKPVLDRRFSKWSRPFWSRLLGRPAR